MGQKAAGDDFTGRFREIVSDPLNLAIRRDPRAGFVEGNHVYLHNGLRVPIAGPGAYYGQFSAILSINRGVHEPLEEFVFQSVLNHLPTAPRMLELGAYWGHYSMWLQLLRPEAEVHLVEPELDNLMAGKHNFELNGFTGEFIQAFVGKGQFEVDQFFAKRDIQKLAILHADIQGYEVEMLEGATQALSAQQIDYIFISTHSQALHLEVVEKLQHYSYRVEVSADFDRDTTSFDGFVFASNLALKPVFEAFTPMGRAQIEAAQPVHLLDYLSTVLRGATTPVEQSL